MSDSHIYRNELKYIVSTSQLYILKERMDAIGHLDKYAKDRGGYNIRSLYFDDYYESCLIDNIIGVDNRVKYRARIYNCDSNYISLEIKHKEHNFGFKEQLSISSEDLEKIVTSKGYNTSDNSTWNRFYTAVKIHRLRPSIIVDYDRIPFVYNEGNVRVTFDMNVASSNRIECFFDTNLAKRPIMPKGMHLMEVKFDGFLPNIVRNTLNLGELRQISYSKYYLCKKI